MLRRGAFLAVLVICVSGAAFVNSYSQSGFEEFKIEQKYYEIPYSGNTLVKLYGTLGEDSARGNKLSFTITNPNGDREEVSVIPSKDGYFENYLVFDRNSVLGDYVVRAYSYDGNLIGKVGFELYNKQQLEAISQKQVTQKDIPPIPSWIKTVAGYWCEDKLDDSSFVEGIKYLIDNDIIVVSTTSSGYGGSQNIPSWIKNNACWWSQDLIADGEFASGLEYLISSGIIHIEEDTQLFDDYIDDYDLYTGDIYDDTDYYEPPPSQEPTVDPRQYCYGSADCFYGYVTKIVDGDTIEVDGKPIRFALANTPEYGEYGFDQATNYVRKICPEGSSVLVDEDDGQTQGSYGRMIAIIHCENVPTTLNEAVLAARLAEIDTRFCDRSEFGYHDWAYKYGCGSSQQEYSPPKSQPSPPKTQPSQPKSEPSEPEQPSCDPSYPDFCIPPSPPDLDCDDIAATDFTVFFPDPHRFDGDSDGIGCESSQPTPEPEPEPSEPEQPSCDPSYPDVCIPPYPPDLDCGEISHRNFKVVGSDPHRFDGDGDGIGCEG